MSITITPGAPAIYGPAPLLKEAEPAKVTIECTVEQANVVLKLLGQRSCWDETYGPTWGLYSKLRETLKKEGLLASLELHPNPPTIYIINKDQA